ncbi:hypothetical protein SNC86_02145, partial [Escherichia coli]|nr:hypothetical protein [Escherichia coli]
SGEKRVFLVILFTSFSGSLVSRIPGAVHVISSVMTRQMIFFIELPYPCFVIADLTARIR